MRQERLRSLIASAERHTHAGRLGRAVRAYRKVLAQARIGEYEHELAQVRLGDLHLGQGRAELAWAHLERARHLAADEPEYALMAGRALAATGRTQEAAGHLFDAVGSPTHAPEALVELARLAGQRGDRRAARRLAAHAGRRDPRLRALSRDYADA